MAVESIGTSISRKWLSFCARLESMGMTADPFLAYQDLQKRYSEPQRFYHTFEHINHCLNEFEAVRHWCVFPDLVEMAIWYHDAVYDPRAHDNEEQSGKLAARIATAIGLPDLFAENLPKLILATKHSESPADYQAKILVDVDLSILGQPSKIFTEYEKNIRKEYQWVPEEKFRTARALILKSFLARTSIYSTAYFRDKYETQARENLGRSINYPTVES